MMLTSARQMKRNTVVPFLNTSAYNLLYGGGCSSSPVCACICEGESVLVSKLETLFRGDVDFRSTNESGSVDRSQLFSCRCSCSQVCVGVGVAVELGITCCTWHVEIGDASLWRC